MLGRTLPFLAALRGGAMLRPTSTMDAEATQLVGDRKYAREDFLFLQYTREDLHLMVMNRMFLQGQT